MILNRSFSGQVVNDGFSYLNQAPIADDDSFSIFTNAQVGDVVGTYTASDDVAVTNYTITGSTLDINSSGLITIADNTGITAGVPIVETVTAYDGEGLTDTATITVLTLLMPVLVTNLLAQTIDLSQWSAGSGGLVRGNDKTGAL